MSFALWRGQEPSRYGLDTTIIALAEGDLIYGNLTPADVYFGRGPRVLVVEREKIRNTTSRNRRLNHQRQACCERGSAATPSKPDYQSEVAHPGWVSPARRSRCFGPTDRIGRRVVGPPAGKRRASAPRRCHHRRNPPEKVATWSGGQPNGIQLLHAAVRSVETMGKRTTGCS